MVTLLALQQQQQNLETNVQIYCQYVRSHTIRSDLKKLRLHFVQFQYTFMWVGIELYSKVGNCLQLNCFRLISLIFYLLFESILQIIYRRLT